MATSCFDSNDREYDEADYRDLDLADRDEPIPYHCDYCIEQVNRGRHNRRCKDTRCQCVCSDE